MLTTWYAGKRACPMRDIYILLLTSFAFSSLMRIFSDRLGSIIVEATMNEKSTVGAAVVSFIVSVLVAD